MKCPYCGYENIEGADTCEECQQSLVELSKPRAVSSVDRTLHRERLSRLENTNPITVTPDKTVGECLKLLVEKSIGVVLVVEGDQLVGIFSERDALMRLNSESAEHFDKPVADFMTPNPETLTPESKLAFALHKMDVGGYRHIPTVDEEGHVHGIVSVRDVLGRITEDLVGAQDS
ncbi:MAG: CBS domain-containing protein [Pirellulales bacterium]|nr:CBS domain-containing protein [Pirellulales bacterium]